MTMVDTAEKRRVARFEPSKVRLPLDQIGGGRVVRQFRHAGEIIKVGTELTVDFIKSIQPANRHALLDRFIAVWPKAPEGAVSPPATDGVEDRTAERHVVALGFGHFKVIQGTDISGTVTKEEAYRIAGKPMPESKAKPDEAKPPQQ